MVSQHFSIRLVSISSLKSLFLVKAPFHYSNSKRNISNLGSSYNISIFLMRIVILIKLKYVINVYRLCYSLVSLMPIKIVKLGIAIQYRYCLGKIKYLWFI